MARGRSLHIGLNSVDPKHYAGWSGHLTACEADAEDMRDLASAQGYATKLLETARATRKAVLTELAQAAKALKAGDIFFLTYSGHGGQVPDRNADEPDQLDETWCLYDGELIDDELYVALSGFAKGVRVFVLSDSCHSGSVVKVALTSLALVRSRPSSAVAADAEPTRFRAMPMDVAQRTYRRNREFYRKIEDKLPATIPTVKASVRLISGCQDNQLSADGPFNGRFTGTLLIVWNDGKFTGNYTEFHDRIVSKMPPDQTPDHFLIGTSDPVFDRQKPFAIAGTAAKSRPAMKAPAPTMAAEALACDTCVRGHVSAWAGVPVPDDSATLEELYVIKHPACTDGALQRLRVAIGGSCNPCPSLSGKCDMTVGELSTLVCGY